MGLRSRIVSLHPTCFPSLGARHDGTRPRKSGSHRTPRWREVDSSLRSLSGNVADPNRWRGKRHRASETAFPLRRDRWFEAGSLQRQVTIVTPFVVLCVSGISSVRSDLGYFAERCSTRNSPPTSALQDPREVADA